MEQFPEWEYFYIVKLHKISNMKKWQGFLIYA